MEHNDVPYLFFYLILTVATTATSPPTHCRLWSGMETNVRIKQNPPEMRLVRVATDRNPPVLGVGGC